MDRQIPNYFGIVVFVTNYDNGKLSKQLWQHTVTEVLILMSSQKALYPCNVPENCDEDSTKTFVFLIFFRVLNMDFPIFRGLVAAQNIVMS